MPGRAHASVNGVAWAGDLASLPAVDRIARRRGPAYSAATWAALLLLGLSLSARAQTDGVAVVRPDGTSVTMSAESTGPNSVIRLMATAGPK